MAARQYAMEERQSFEQMIRASKQPVLVDVYSDTCAPCHAMKPVLKELKDRFGEKLRIIKINGPQNMKFMRDYRIEAFPTLMLFQGGKIAWTQLGYTPTSRLERMIKDAVPA
jgi:thioredoxin 1